ncbi:unnamed protein product [Ambrosiozyma monospora]|uniref:Unnamed protein product n=1 Tax=Ambrosiozyma monospora TaxID=43982 RepID=A0A9W6Z1G2_AMBMO|nr:unnamed protein product [Ambrosiozyma monospora]
MLINDSVYKLQHRGLLNNNITVSESQEQNQHQNQENDFDQAFNDIEMELNEQQQHQGSSVADKLMESVEQQQYHDQEMQTSDARTSTISKEQATAPSTTEPQQQQENAVTESSKIEFAKLAQSVFQTMSNTPSNISTTTSTKFKNSQFLMLMDKIAKRQVEINDSCDKLVDSRTGDDVRASTLNVSAGVGGSETTTTGGHLGDPLALVNDGEFEFKSPLESAQVVHERVGGFGGLEQGIGSLKTGSWEEVI